jgi:hypothetical protein
MIYSRPDTTSKQDALAHSISEIDNDRAPLGWEKYRGLAGCLLAMYDIKPKETHPDFERFKEAWND